MTTPLRSQLQSALGAGYTLDRELGGGGMSHVFLAHDATLDRAIVVKVLPPDMAGAISIQRFNREILTAARLQHPNIVPVLSAGEADGLPFFTMPFIQGRSLRALLVERGEGNSLPVAEALRILRDVANALAFAHQHGVVHRDVKPENVLIAGGSAMVTDFGVAKAVAAAKHPSRPGVDDAREAGALTMTGMALGTPAYMAPEQAAADPGVDARADVYSWGVLAHELLTGTVPHRGGSLAKRDAVPQALDALVTRCLALDPAHRPADGSEIVRVLDELTTPRGGTPAARVSRTRVALATVIIVTVVALAIMFSRRRAATTDVAHTVAVIPVVVAERDTAQQYVSDGIADDITAALLQVKALNVINRSSANAFKARLVDTRGAAKALGVDHIVELTVRPNGNGVRVNADLVSASDGVVRWSQRFDSDRDNLSVLGDRIARELIPGLHLASTEAASLRAAHQPTPAAYDAYSRQRFFIDRSAGRADFDSAQSYFHRATAADPRFAAPYVAAAVMHIEALGTYAPSVEYDYAQADSLVRLALALDPSSADAHAVFGWTQAVLTWNWPAARREFEQAVRLDPSSAIAHRFYGLYWACTGALDSATTELQRASTLDPYHPFTKWILTTIWLGRGQADSAMSVQRQMLQTTPGFFMMEDLRGDVYRMRGAYDSALAVDREAARRNGSPTAGLVLSLERTGHHDEAEQAYRQMVTLADTTHSFILYEIIGRAALAAGHHDEAMKWFDRAATVHSDYTLTIRHHADLAPLATDTAYARIMQRMHLRPGS